MKKKNVTICIQRISQQYNNSCMYMQRNQPPHLVTREDDRKRCGVQNRDFCSDCFMYHLKTKTFWERKLGHDMKKERGASSISRSRIYRRSGEYIFYFLLYMKKIWLWNGIFGIKNLVFVLGNDEKGMRFWFFFSI